MPKATAVDDTITVTTATGTEEEVRQALGVDTPKPDDAAATAAKVKATEQEADSEKPDTDVSEAARKLRGNRADIRKKKIQDEIDDLTRRKHRAREEYDAEERRLAARRQAPPPAGEKPAAGDKPADDPSAPKFKFATWDEYQIQHPEADYTEYTDARTDARYAHNRKVDEHSRQLEKKKADDDANANAQNAAVKTFGEAVDSFKAEHADYDDVTGRIQLKSGTPAEQMVVESLRRAVLREGKNGPAILYYLATHADEVARLQQSHGPADFLETWGEIKYAVRVAAKTAPVPDADAVAAAAAAAAAGATKPPPPAPPKPKTSAPAPIESVPGSASSTRSLQSIAEESEDADDYIATRKAQIKAGR